MRSGDLLKYLSLSRLLKDLDVPDAILSKFGLEIPFGIPIQLVCDGPKDGQSNGQTEGRTDGRTHPLIEMRRRI